MKQIRNMIARRRPASQPTFTDASTPAPGETAGSGMGLMGDLDAAAEEPTEMLDRHLAAAREARDAVPRFAQEPRQLRDGRPTQMMSESAIEPDVDLPRKKIWDLDTDNAAPAPDQPKPRRMPPPVPPRDPGFDLNSTDSFPTPESLGLTEGLAKHVDKPSEPAPKQGRVKTRLLGFHAEDLGQDIFEKPASPKGEQNAQFPIGWLVVVDGPGRGASFSLVAGLSTIGRAADQTVTLDYGDSSISRENHASIAYDEEENTVYIGHGGKSNIVRLNGKPLLTTEKLEGAELIRIGKTTLRFVALCGPDFRWSEGEDEGAQDVENE